MTITLTGTLTGTRTSRRSERVATEAPGSSTRASDEPAVCSLGSTFDDTAWAATIGCRPLFATRTPR